MKTFRSWLHVVTKNLLPDAVKIKEITNTERMNEWITDSLVFMENNQDLHPIDEDEPDLGKLWQIVLKNLKVNKKNV